MEIFIENIGKVNFKKSSLAKKIAIRIKPFVGISVTIPQAVSLDKAKEFVFAKQDWIIKNYSKIENYEKKLTVFTPKICFKTFKHELSIKEWDKDIFSIKLSNGKINVKYPSKVPVENPQIQKRIRSGIENVLRIEALEYLPGRTAFLAKKLAFSYTKITINNLKSRWGACTYDNIISLNMQLMRLNTKLIDYVIIHELCHTVHKNHSSLFWNLMEKVLPSAKSLAKEMRKYNTKIW